MTDVVSKRGGWRPGAGRKAGSCVSKRDEKSRVEAALASTAAAELFDRARRGSFPAAKALSALLRAADRLGLLPAERELAPERATRDWFWLLRSRPAARDRPPDLFGEESAPARSGVIA